MDEEKRYTNLGPPGPDGSQAVGRLDRGEPGRQFGVDRETLENLKLTRNLAEPLEREPAPTGTMQADVPLDPWRHRAAGMRCRTCMWFVLKTPEAGWSARPGIGRCRRHAPTMNGYPVVYDADWCGDHKLDETKA